MLNEKSQFDMLRNSVTAKEAVYGAELTSRYKSVYNSIKKEMESLSSKMTDGVFNRTDMYKLNRYDKLVSDITKELNILDSKIGVEQYLASQYDFSKKYTTFILEKQYQVELKLTGLNKAAVEKATQSKYGKIALKNNKVLAIENIKQAITDSIIRGDGIAKMSQSIKGAIEGNLNNTFRIARTETTNVMNAAEEDQIRETNEIIPLEKGWLATLDDSTRDSHADLDGEYVSVDEEFSNGLMYPGDQSGDPEDSINCRCVLITRVKGYESAEDYRAARGVDGKNALIKDTSYNKWLENKTK